MRSRTAPGELEQPRRSRSARSRSWRCARRCARCTSSRRCVDYAVRAGREEPHARRGRARRLAARVDLPDRGGARARLPRAARLRAARGREARRAGRAAPPAPALVRGGGRGPDARTRSSASCSRPSPRRERAISAATPRSPRASCACARAATSSTSLTGAYRSAFRGQGLTFEELRDYAPGDDVRWIEWNATARLGRPIVEAHARGARPRAGAARRPVASLDFGAGDGDQARRGAPRGGGAGGGRDRVTGSRRARRASPAACAQVLPPASGQPAARARVPRARRRWPTTRSPTRRARSTGPPRSCRATRSVIADLGLPVPGSRSRRCAAARASTTWSRCACAIRRRAAAQASADPRARTQKGRRARAVAAARAARAAALGARRCTSARCARSAPTSASCGRARGSCPACCASSSERARRRA